MNEKFDLSQNSFVIFMFSYAPGLIIGALIIVSTSSFLPEIVRCVAYTILLIAMVIKGIMDLQLNKRSLVISDDSIAIYLKKRKNDILLTKIDNNDIQYIRQFKDEAFIITKKNGEEVTIPLSCALKPYKILLYSVKKVLYKAYGNERTDFEQDNLLLEFNRTEILPEELLVTDRNSKITRLFLMIAYLIFAGLPTFLCILTLLVLFLMLIIAFLKGLLAIISA